MTTLELTDDEISWLEKWIPHIVEEIKNFPDDDEEYDKELAIGDGILIKLSQTPPKTS